MSNQQTERGANLLDYLKAWPTYLLPHHALSRVMHAITRSEVYWWKSRFTLWFVKQFNVDMSLAQEPDLEAYSSFNAFFTRALRTDARPINDDTKTLACPVDGSVSQLGDIKNGRIFQAKGRDYSLLELLGGDVRAAEQFENGKFATLYLSPRDYHRIHIPMDGKLTAMTHIPGRLFSVSPATARAVPRLFARNERVVAYFDTEVGPMAMVMVGAIFVASIETVWAGEVTPPAGKEISHWKYETDNTLHNFTKGDEIGRFNMGSTVIQLHAADTIDWLNDIKAGDSIQMGEALATYL
jgi:phosphatidylserine decarboxylase